MEVAAPTAWMIAGYEADAAWAVRTLCKGSPPEEFQAGVLGLLNTFVRWHAFIRADPGATRAVLALALAHFHHLDFNGRWNEILQWWPALEVAAGEIGESELQFELRIQRARIQNYGGELAEVDCDLQTWQGRPEFEALPCRLKAEFYLQAGICALRTGRVEAAVRLLENCLALPQPMDPRLDGSKSGDSRSAADECKAAALNQLGNLAVGQMDFIRAESCYTECLELALATGSENLAAIARCSLGRLYAVFMGRTLEAVQVLEQNNRIAAEKLGMDGAAESSVCLALAYSQCGRFDEARQLANQTLQFFQDVDHRAGIWMSRIVLGLVQQKQGRGYEAVFHWQAALEALHLDAPAVLELYALRLLLPEQVRQGSWQQAAANLSRLLRSARRSGVSLRMLLGQAKFRHRTAAF